MNIVLWILQIFLGVVFVFIGRLHLTLPPDLPDMLGWMYDLPQWLHYFTGAAELLGGLGLILPGLFRVQTRLTPLAAAGLSIIMLGAAVFQISRGAVPNMVVNLLLAALAGFVAFGRWRINPLPDRAHPTPA